MAVLNYNLREFRANQASILSDVDAREGLKLKIAKARENFNNGKGVVCETIEDSMALFNKL